MQGAILLEVAFAERIRQSSMYIEESGEHFADRRELLGEAIMASRDVRKHIEVSVVHLREIGMIWKETGKLLRDSRMEGMDCE